MEIFKKRLKETVKEQGLTAYKISKDLDLSVSLVSYWINGNVLPGIEHFKKLCEYLDISADYLLGLEDYSGVKTTNQVNKNIFIKM